MEKNTKEALAQILFFVLTFIPMVMLNAWATLVMYNWWVLPLTKYQLSFKVAVGVWTCVAFLRTSKKVDKDEPIYDTVLTSIVFTGMTLLVNLVLHLIFGY